MRFIDYYSILEIPFNSTDDELKKAYRVLSMKYHPDRNKDNPSSTLKQQEINEAYYILGNAEKKKAYDVEYLRYQEFVRNSTRQKHERDTKSADQNSKEKERQRTDNKSYQNQTSYEEFEVFDERLKDWMTEAKKQASQVAKQAAADFTGVVKEGAFAALGGLFTVIIWIIVINVIYFIFKSCQ
jgi:curved DNA-binding protein CbpA